MITKQHEQGPEPTDPRRKAGAEAEKQMAFYLHRAFAQHPGLFVINNLRIVDPNQPEFDGSPGVCQIDHLILHRWGAFIIESKSVHGEVTVRPDGHGGQQWTRRSGRSESGFACPVQQARRQGEFLRGYLQSHKADLLGRAPVGTRTVVKMIFKTDQRGFRMMPIQVFIAFSEKCIIHRLDGWSVPDGPFQTIVTKNDQITGTIKHEYDHHKNNSSLLRNSDPNYGMWYMTESELGEVSEFLKSNHTPSGNAHPRTRQAQARAPKVKPGPRSICRKCQGPELTARSGPYGYYWNCNACGENTPMGAECSACGRNGKHDKSVRIHKQGPQYERRCEPCGHNELIWTEHQQA